MKKITVKVITISSQLLVVALFLFLLFPKNDNGRSLMVYNTNFNKTAKSTSELFAVENKKKENDKEDDKEDEFKEEVIAPLDDVNKKEEKKETPKEEVVVEGPNLFYDREVIDTIENSVITGYGANCYGCSGRTRSGHDLTKSMYYEDSEFGTVRILAADPSFGVNAIFRVSGIPGLDTFIAIVLDTGGNVGYGRGTMFDLAFVDENDPNLIPKTNNVKFELLRKGVSW